MFKFETGVPRQRFALTAQVEPRFDEDARALLGQHAVHQRVNFRRGRADKGERRWPQAQLKQPAAVAADAVVVALRRRDLRIDRSGGRSNPAA
ncbi:MAG: hypothetical protein IPL62_20670 [Caulobacteraceae bacterium]|nr:hypothetical protein [Caulobacteraceae bacterium]